MVKKFKADKKHMELVKKRFDNICSISLDIENDKRKGVCHVWKDENVNHLPELLQLVETLPKIHQDLGDMQRNLYFIQNNSRDEDAMNHTDLDKLAGLLKNYEKTTNRINALSFSRDDEQSNDWPGDDNDNDVNSLPGGHIPDVLGTTGNIVASRIACGAQVIDNITTFFRNN